MKKLKKYFVVLAMVLLLMSCTFSAGIIFDDAIPIEETAWLNVSNVGTVTSFNGIPVQWKTSFGKAIQIPKGTAVLEFDLYLTMGNTTYTGRGIVFAYTFDPGKQYFFMGSRQDEVLGLKIYEYDIHEKVKLSNSDMEKHFLAFAPFLNLGGPGGKTVLE